MSRELLTSPSALFDMLDDASLRWFLCHPTPCGPNPNVVEPWTQTDWMCTFNVFTVGSYIANKLEQMIWKGYVASLPTTTLVASPEGLARLHRVPFRAFVSNSCMFVLCSCDGWPHGG